jgi:predicted MFS family arabinose efflux permease
MTPPPPARASALAPFAVRSFRFQWPADLATSLAFEMEALILGWYVLTATGSVQYLVMIAALAWLGTLFSPLLGIVGDRIGVRTLLCATRAVYALLAAALTALSLGGVLAPWHVFVLSAIAGLLRPSDMAMRHVLVAQTMRSDTLIGALAVSRTTSDTARIVGALAGTGGVALFGMGAAYAAVTALYVAAFLLSLGVAAPDGRRSHADTLAALAQAMRYVWGKPDLLGAWGIAFLVNLLAFPFFLGLLPFVAKDVYGVGQAGLGYLAMAFWSGALAGSLAVGANRWPMRAARVMLWTAGAWFVTIVLFGQTPSMAAGLVLLFLSGFVQSFCLTPLAAVMLRSSSEEMRGPVMGIRMLAIWGLPLGLLAAGPIIERYGYAACTLLYGGLGLAATLAIGYGWRRALWDRSAAANSAT